jgi:hypothetical protein
MAKQQSPTATNRVEQLVKRFLTAKRTTEEAICLDELATELNNGARSALTPALIRRLTKKYRAATNSVERGNRLTDLAVLADKTENAPLKWYILEAAEASTKKGDDILRIDAIKLLPGLEFPNRQFERRVIDWIASRLDIPKGWPGEERIYAIDALGRWINTPRVQAELLRLVEDETMREDYRSLALNEFWLCKSGKLPARAIKVCQRLISDPDLNSTAEYVLRCHGIKTHKPEPEGASDGDRPKPPRRSRSTRRRSK